MKSALKTEKRAASEDRPTLSTVSDEGIFSGYASVFHEPDSQRDVLLPGAFVYADKPKLLWQHDCKVPIGKVIGISEDKKGLFITARLSLAVQKAREVYCLLKERVIDGLSIGYFPISYYMDDFKKLRILECVELWEISVVTFPANSRSRVLQVKQHHKKIPCFVHQKT